MNKSKKTSYAFLFFAAVMSIVLFLLTIKRRNLSKSGCKTVAVVESVMLKGITWSYWINGVRFETETSRMGREHIVEGEKYNIYYDCNYPLFAEPSSYEPVIDEFEVDTLISLPIYAKFKKGGQKVLFEYVVDGDTIQRIQKFRFKNDFAYSGNKFKVYYKSKTPKIGYINLSQ